MSRPCYCVVHNDGNYTDVLSRHWTLSGAQRAFRSRNRHIYDPAYADRMGLRNAGTFDEIWHYDENGETDRHDYSE